MAANNVVKLNEGLAKALKKVSSCARLEGLTITIQDSTYIIEYGNFELNTGDAEHIEQALNCLRQLDSLGADFSCD